MKLFKNLSINLVLVSLTVFFCYHVFSKDEVGTLDGLSSHDELVKVKETEERKAILGQFTIHQMDEVNSKLSPLKRQVLARIIAGVVTEIFTELEHQKAFITVLAIESSFNKFAQSPTGPRGMSQVAKAAFKEGMELCAGVKYNEEDVWDESINVLGGACYFKKILEQKTNGDIFAAIVAYNQGMNSEAFKNYQKGGKIGDNKEALNYMSRFVYLTKPVISKEEKVVVNEK